MKKIVFSVLLLVIFLHTVHNAEARLTILSPQQMLETSDLILIGTVMNKNETDDNRKVTLSIDATVKGTIDKTQIELEQAKDRKYGWLGFDFPGTGEKVMVLLQRNDQAFFLTGDSNGVAVVGTNASNHSSLKLYHGATMGQWTPKHYEDTYKAFLAGVNQGVKPHHLQHKIFSLLNVAVVIGIILVPVSLLYRLKKKKR